jgi:hypothetical protein
MKGSQKLMNTIKKENIRPHSKFRVDLFRILGGLGFVLATVLGAAAFSVILFAVQQTDFNVLSHLEHSPLELTLGLLPIVWITALVLFLFVGMYSIRYSKKGYKFTLAKRVGYSAALSILLGTLFFITGGGKQLENAFALQVSLYESVQEKKVRLWSMPEQGYLSGTILSVEAENFRLEDFSGQDWTVNYESAFSSPVVLIERNEQVKIMGQKSGEKQFLADEIRPWGGPGSRMGKRKKLNK